MKTSWKAYGELKKAKRRLSRLYRPESKLAERARAFIDNASKAGSSAGATSSIRAASELLDKLAAEERIRRRHVRQRNDKIAQAARERMEMLRAGGFHFRTVAARMGSIYFYVWQGDRWFKIRYSDHQADAGWASHGRNGSGYRLPDEDNVIATTKQVREQCPRHAPSNASSDTL